MLAGELIQPLSNLFREKSKKVQLFQQNIVGGSSVISVDTTSLVKQSFETTKTNCAEKL